jgi:glyoxylase-like metal-dependent hydrolase (beta-lactamase superfamily II)
MRDRTLITTGIVGAVVAARPRRRRAASHTDGDISVAFTDADILHTGDTYWNGIYPFIDYSTGGSIDGTIRATEANLTAVTDKTVIIPGHGPPVSNRSELKDYRPASKTFKLRRQRTWPHVSAGPRHQSPCARAHE